MPPAPPDPQPFRDLVAAWPDRSSGSVHLERVDIGPGRWAAWIWIDHPPSRNALTPRMMVQLADAAQAAQAASAIVLQGANKTFCSGGNLDEVRDHLGQHGQGRTFGAFMQHTVATLRRRPLYAALEGVAMGGGAELLAACRGVVAAPGARVGFVHARLGVTPGFGGGCWLSSRVGPERAAEILRNASLLQTAQAHAIGLIDRVQPEPVSWLLDQLRAGTLPALPAPPLRATTLLPPHPLPPAVDRGIATIIGMQGATEAEALAVELDVFADLWGGPDHRAALDERTERK